MPSFCDTLDKLFEVVLPDDLVVDDFVVVDVYFDFDTVELFDVFLLELQAQQSSARAIINSDFGIEVELSAQI